MDAVAARRALFQFETFDFDESEHPRDSHGRFGEGDGQPGSAKPMHLAAGERGVRDALVEGYRTNFLKAMGDYPEQIAAAKAAGEPTPPPEGGTQALLWRDAMGYKPFSPYEGALVNAFIHGDTRALGTIRASATKNARELNPDAVRPEALATMHEAIDRLNADPRTADLMERYGTPRILAAATAPGETLEGAGTPSGDTGTDGTIRLFENGFERAGDVYPTAGPLKPGGPTVSSGTRLGTLTHEFGHHVDNGLTDEQHDQWNAIYDRRHAKYDADFEAANHAADPYQARIGVQKQTISYYSMNSGRTVPRGNRSEGFAETFASVMHPDYDRNQFDPSNHEMLAFVEGIVGPKR